MPGGSQSIKLGNLPASGTAGPRCQLNKALATWLPFPGSPRRGGEVAGDSLGLSACESVCGWVGGLVE